MEVFDILKKFIAENPILVKKYKVMGIFGSSLKKSKFKDIDFFSVGDNNAHHKFKLELTKLLEKRNYKVIFFKTIKKLPKKHSRTILMHDLHFKNFEQYRKREWPVIIDVISRELLILYGSKKDLPKITMTKYLLCYPHYNWLEKIKTKKEFDNFRDYLVKVVPMDYKRYPYLNINKDSDKLLQLCKIKNWKKAKEEILNVFNSK